MQKALNYVVLSVLGILVLCTWLKPIDSTATDQINTGLKRAMISYASARTLNAAISVAEGTEVSFQPGGVGLNFTPGRALEPINELVEQFSVLMLVACIAFGVQKILISIGGFWLVSLVLTVAALGWAWFYLNQQRPPVWISKILVILLMVRFAIPIVTLGTDLIFQKYMSDDYTASQSAIGTAPNEITEISAPTPAPTADQGLIDRMKEKAHDLWTQAKSMADVKAQYSQLKQKAEQWAEHIIKLIVIFMLQTLIIPALLMWVLYAVAKGTFEVKTMTPKLATSVQ
jgi:hypothetical protein